MTKSQQAMINYLVEKKKELPTGQERNGYALCLEDMREYIDLTSKEQSE